MRAFTISGEGSVQCGIALRDGRIDMGRRAVDGLPFSVSIDAKAEIDGTTLIGCEGNGALIFFVDQMGAFGDWRLRGSFPEDRWDMVASAHSIANGLDRVLEIERIHMAYPESAPVGWHELARGISFMPENARPDVCLYGYLKEGASFEVVRTGMTRGAPAVSRVSCVSGEVILSDPLADAVQRLSQRST